MKKMFSGLLLATMLIGSAFQIAEINAFEFRTTYAEFPAISEQAMLLSGNANRELSNEVAKYLGVELADATVEKFNDSEISIRIKESVRDKAVFIIQPTCSNGFQSVNDNVMELYLLIRTLKRASVGSVTAVIPYYGYARQDRKSAPRVPISAADIALLLEVAGVDRVVTIDLHCGQIQGFFHNVAVDNLYGSTMFIPYFASKEMHDVVVVSPDAGGAERAKQFVESLAKKGISARMAMISKQRAKAGVVGSMSLIGDVNGADTIIVDDMCDTAGTLVLAAQLLKNEGAKHVYAAITHPVFSGAALERIENSVIDEMVISNTIPLSKEAPANIRCISVAPLLAEAIRRIHNGESVSDLFQ